MRKCQIQAMFSIVAQIFVFAVFKLFLNGLAWLSNGIFALFALFAFLMVLHYLYSWGAAAHIYTLDYRQDCSLWSMSLLQQTHETSRYYRGAYHHMVYDVYYITDREKQKRGTIQKQNIGNFKHFGETGEFK